MTTPKETAALVKRRLARRILDLAWTRGGSTEQVAALLQAPVERVLHDLSLLKTAGLARSVILHRPQRSGLPIHVRTLVRLSSPEPAARDIFEARCLDDPLVDTAAAVTGDFDYLLTGYHPHERAVAAWRLLLQSRPEVGSVDCQLLDVRFGHMLTGALIDGPLRHGENPSEAA